MTLEDLKRIRDQADDRVARAQDALMAATEELKEAQKAAAVADLHLNTAEARARGR